MLELEPALLAPGEEPLPLQAGVGALWALSGRRVLPPVPLLPPERPLLREPQKGPES